MRYFCTGVPLVVTSPRLINTWQIFEPNYGPPVAIDKMMTSLTLDTAGSQVMIIHLLPEPIRGKKADTLQEKSRRVYIVVLSFIKTYNNYVHISTPLSF